MPNPGDFARQQLMRRERETQLRVILEFKKIQKRLQFELFELMVRIEKARRTEGNAPVGLLIQQARIRNLFDQVSDEIFRSSQRLGLDTANLQKAAVDIAKDEAGKYAALRADLSFFDADATRELIGIGGDGEPLGTYFARLAKPIRQSMFDALFYGIATGRTNAQIAREINAAVGNGAAAAMTIVRTEANRTYRESTRKYYDQAPDVSGWRWVAALDLNTCPICWAFHGRIFPTRQKMATHPNCRCTMVPVFPDDPKVPTGSDLFAKLTIEQQRAILGPGRLKLYNRGANLSDFVQSHPTPFGPGRRIRPINLTTFKPRARIPAASASDSFTRPPSPEPAFRTGTPEPALPAAIAAGEPLPIFGSAIQATQYFERRYPGIKFDFERVDYRDGFLQAQAAEISRLLDTYPETAARLKYFGTYDDAAKIPANARRFTKFKRGEFAHCASDGTFIGLNPIYYSDRNNLRATLIRCKKTGWLISDEEQSGITHEFGHAIDAWIRRDAANDFLVPNTTYQDTGRIQDLAEAIAKKYKPTPGEQSDYSIAGRGRRQKAEQFAEAFSMLHNRPAAEHSRYARFLGRLIDAIRTRRIDAKDTTVLRDLSEDERRLAKKAINDLYSEFGLKGPFGKDEL